MRGLTTTVVSLSWGIASGALETGSLFSTTLNSSSTDGRQSTSKTGMWLRTRFRPYMSAHDPLPPTTYCGRAAAAAATHALLLPLLLLLPPHLPWPHLVHPFSSRTYYPDAYRQYYPNAKTHLSSKVRSALPDGSSIFEKTHSKKRRPFTEEDRALKAGYDRRSTV